MSDRTSPISAYRLRRALSIAAASCLVLMLAASASAHASVGTGYLRQFGTATIVNPSAVAVDQSSGSAYVSATSPEGAQEIFAFEPSTGAALTTITGAATPQESFSEVSAVAVDQEANELYVLDSAREEIDEFSASGEYVGQFGDASEEPGPFPAGDVLAGIAVDPTSGDVLVSDETADTVTRFTASGAYLSQFGRPGSGDAQFDGAAGVAVAASGTVYVVDREGSRVEELSATGHFLEELHAASPRAVAINSATDEVYVGDSGGSGYYGQPGSYHILQYGPSGTLLGDFGYGFVASSTGIAFDQTSGELLVADHEGNDIAVFGQATLPEATTESAANPTATGATLSGTVEPAGGETHYFFQYGTSTEYGAESPERPGEVAEGSSVAASTTLDGLEANTAYHYRLVATNAAGATYGADMSFTTEQAAPLVSEESATATSSTEAELSGHIAPGNLPTTYRFEYGTSPTAYEADAPIPDGEAGSSPIQVSQPVTELHPDTIYYFRLAASNEANGTLDTSYGEQQSFTTPALKPVSTLGPAAAIGRTTATLTGAINPEGSPATYQFEVTRGATCLAHGSIDFRGKICQVGEVTESPSPSASAGTGTSPVPVQTTATGLAPDTTYSYLLRVNGERSFSMTVLTFTTLPEPPTSGGEGAADIAPTSATAVATVDPNGGAATYHFEYGTSSAYGATAPSSDASAGAATVAGVVSTRLANLQPATTYHYRVVATNVSGTSYGPDTVFTTISSYATPPVVSTGDATSVGPYGATIAGTLDANGSDSSYRFEYGTTNNYGMNSESAVPGGSGSQAISISVSALQPSTTYHYRLLATNAGGTAYGNDATFTTAAAPLAATAPPISGLKPLPAGTPANAKPKPLTRAQKLAKALKACKRHRKKAKRAVCESQAHRRYGPAKKTQNTKTRAAHGKGRK